MARTLVWFRGKDLRLADHGPLRAALDDGDALLLFVLDPYFFSPERAQELPHRMQFLLDSLRSLAANIEHKGGQLMVVEGRSIEVIPKIVDQEKIDRVVAHRWVEPFGRARDDKIREALSVPFDLFEGEMLHQPGTLRTQTGGPYNVFTPFSRAFRKSIAIDAPLPAPRSIPQTEWFATETTAIPTLTDLGIERNDQLLEGGERAARSRMQAFLQNHGDEYDRARDMMGEEKTSRLSADLKFGTLSVRTLWHTALAALGDSEAGRIFSNELLWREFSYSTLWDRPAVLKEPFRPQFKDFPWVFDQARWDAWVGGKTGYPVVDAAARQLVGEGFVHNRARMIAASFLCKHLLISYTRGEAHYMKYLTDGDWASNNAGWQWSAGCGCDAQPYFRVFNPMTQGQKFDPDGRYVRRWLPELSRLPNKYIHQPWTAPDAILEEAEVELGKNYPHPIVDHKRARIAFLETAQGYLKKL